METYVIREHELRIAELEERAQLFRDEPRRPRRRLFGRRKPVITATKPPTEPTINPWHATYIRAA